MNDRTLFRLDPSLNDRPMTEHPLYRWLVDNEHRFYTRGAGILEHYLKRLGFNPDRHRLDPDDYDTLRTVQAYYTHTWMPRRTPADLRELFIPGNPDIHSDLFWLRDGHNTSLGTDKVAVSDSLVALVEETSPIYDLNPEEYCFEMVNDILFLKYQNIIGSRRLCPLKGSHW